MGEKMTQQRKRDHRGSAIACDLIVDHCHPLSRARGALRMGAAGTARNARMNSGGSDCSGRRNSGGTQIRRCQCS